MDEQPLTTDCADRERALTARTAAHASWAATPDREARTRPARGAFLARFERQVDPVNLLTPQERRLRAEAAKRACFQGLALKSAKVRRQRRSPASGGNDR